MRLQLSMVMRAPRITIAQIEQQRIDLWQRNLPQMLKDRGYSVLEPPLIRRTRAAYVYLHPKGCWVAEAVAFDTLHRRTWPQEQIEGPTPESVDAAHQNHKVWVYNENMRIA